MIRTSSTIDGEILIIDQVPPRLPFREIHNTTQSNKFPPIFKSINQKILSFDSQDLNNPENTKIIESGPSDYDDEDEKNQSIKFQSVSSSSSDDEQSLTVLSSDEEEDLIKYEQIKEFLIDDTNEYELEGEVFHTSDETFLNTIEIVETYNQVLYNLFSTEIEITKISLKEFLKSVLTQTSKSYFIKCLSQVLKMVIHSYQDFLSESFVFSMRLIDLVQNSSMLTIKTTCLILFKLFNSANFLTKPHGDKTNILSRCHGSMEERINLVQDMNELSLEEKLRLFNLFIDVLNNKKPKTYRSKLDEIESQIEVTRKQISNLYHNNHRFNYFQIDEEESFIDFRNIIEEKNKHYIDLTSQFETLLRKEPFGQLAVENEHFRIYFWHFECLKNSLMVEKRPYNSNYNFDDSKFDFSQEKSEWYFISNMELMKKLFRTVSSNVFDSNFVNEFLEVIEKSFEDEIENRDDCVNLNESKQDDEEATFLKVLNEFKLRLVDANFIDFDIKFDSDFAINSYVINENFTKFNELFSTLSNPNQITTDDKFKSYIELLVTLYGMINRKYLSTKFTSLNHDTIWNNMIVISKTIEQLNFAIFLLDQNINWEKSKIGEICNLCKSETSEEYKDKIIVRCSNCPLSYHLNCLLNVGEASQNVETDANNNEVPIKIYKLRRLGKLLCYSCLKKIEDEFKQIEELNEQKRVEKSKELATIEVNNYSLRLNKLRVIHMDNIKEKAAKKAPKKPRKSFIATSTDDTGSVDSDFVPEKKTRGRKKKIIESSSSQSDAGYEPRSTRPRKRKSDTDSDYEAQVVVNEQKEAEIEERRNRLGLRARPKKTNRMF